MPLKTPERKAAAQAAMRARLTAPAIEAAEPGIKLTDAAKMLGVCRDTARKLIRADGGFWPAGNGRRKHMRTSLSTIRRIKGQSLSPHLGLGGNK